MDGKPKVVIPPPEFYRALQRLLGLETVNVHRIVIDFPCRDIPQVYVEYHGDERMLQIVKTLEGIELNVVAVRDL